MTPFTVLHVCMGNICRSPMAERLLTAHAAAVFPDESYVFSHSAGTGGWHVGDAMNPPAARELRARGVSPDGFAARQLSGAHIDSSDLVLTATIEQTEYVAELRPDATERTFVLGEFGRLLPAVDLTELPAVGESPEAVHARGVALVAAVSAAGTALRDLPKPADEIDDPWGMGGAVFTRVADSIDAPIRALVRALTTSDH